MIRTRIVMTALAMSLTTGLGHAQTNSGGGTRGLGVETRPAELAGVAPGGRAIMKPAELGIGTTATPFLKNRDITSSTIGGGTGGGSPGIGTNLGSGSGGGDARPPKPTTVCAIGKTWVFSDALGAWFCL